MHGMPRLDYNQTPFLIIWETTQACALACLHCRASARPEHDTRELTTEEGEDLLRQAKRMGTPIFILSGGDPLQRTDLYRLIRFGARLGLRMATIPAATDRLTEDVVIRLKGSGLSQMALSLDFPTANLHDEFRGVPGSYAKTMQAAGWAHRHRLPLQINTTLTAKTLPHLSAMAELVTSLGVVFWEVFFLVPTGRGASLAGLSPADCERAFEILHEVQRRSEFLLKVTEAPHYRRYVVQQEWKGAAPSRPAARPGVALPEMLTRTEGPGHTIGLASQGVNAGNGFLFISHIGEVFPSGFLPIPGGNVRVQDLSDIYRHSPLFRQLRRPDEFGGICGICEFRTVCGGSRSRAFALTGDYLASDPWCAHRPAA
jgi:radical SAM protein